VLDAREHEMEWMVKGKRVICSLVLSSCFGFLSPCQFSNVIPLVDMCTHIGVYHIVLCVCDAGKGVDC
jgi:hypothetical protein